MTLSYFLIHFFLKTKYYIIIIFFFFSDDSSFVGDVDIVLVHSRNELNFQFYLIISEHLANILPN